MIIDCISDLHGFHPNLPGGDLLIVAGDLTARDDIDELFAFGEWLGRQPYKKKIFISGNHDNEMVGFSHIGFQMGRQAFSNCEYLFDSGTELEGLKIWGSPWTKTFEGMNPHCKAFTVNTEEELAEKWAMIPDDINILITHSPPYGILDTVRKDGPFSHEREQSVGSQSLLNRIRGSSSLRLHVFGHIHEWGAQSIQIGHLTTFVNASHVDENYKPVNKPIRYYLHAKKNKPIKMSI